MIFEYEYLHESTPIPDKTHKYPVYVVLMNGKTPLAKMILKVTKDYFSHSCIAFNSKLDPLYSFGVKSKNQGIGLGFSISNPQDKSVFDRQAYYSVYVTYVTKSELDKMKSAVKSFEDKQDDLKYDFKGLVNIAFGKDSETHTKYFCSRFVAEILSISNNLTKVPSLYKPQDFADNSEFTLINRGFDFMNYDYKITDRNEKLLRDGKLDSESIYFESASTQITKDENGNYKERLNLNSFTRITLSDAICRVYSKKVNSLTRIPINNKTKGFIWLDNSNDCVVAVVNVLEKDNGDKWIQTFEIFHPYQGKGLSKQILDIVIRQLQGQYISIQKSSNVAIKVLKSKGFKVYKSSGDTILMSRDKQAGDDDEDINESAFMKYTYVSENDFDDFLHANYIKESEWKSKYRAKFIAVYKTIISRLKALDRQLPYNDIINYPDKDPEDWPSNELIKMMDKYKGGPNDQKDGICTKSLVVCEYNERAVPLFKRAAIEDKITTTIVNCIPDELENTSNKMFFRIAKNGSGRYILLANSIIMNESALIESTVQIDGENGFFDKHNRWNPIVIINNEQYRYRVECLVIRGARVFLSKNPRTGEYIIPGGGVDKVIPNEDQVANECKEEARMVITNIENTGIQYVDRKGVSEKGKKCPPEEQWVGAYNEVYIADYVGHYRGAIEKVDQDPAMMKGQFVEISQVYNKLKPEWQEALACRFEIEIEEAVKFYKNPRIALKRKNTMKKKSNVDIGKQSIDVSVPSPTKKESNDSITSDIAKVAEDARKLLTKEIFACKDCASAYEDLMCPKDNDFAIIGWNLNKLSDADKISFPKCRDAVFSYCKKIFEDTHPRYQLLCDDMAQCFYIHISE